MTHCTVCGEVNINQCGRRGCPGWEKEPMTTTDQLLDERAKTHGDFTTTARVARELKAIVHSEVKGKLSHSQAECLDMILSKVGRIVSGDPNFPEHWDDIAGYAKLAADRCKT